MNTTYHKALSCYDCFEAWSAVSAEADDAAMLSFRRLQEHYAKLSPSKQMRLCRVTGVTAAELTPDEPQGPTKPLKHDLPLLREANKNA